jgi:hypothetical protein
MTMCGTLPWQGGNILAAGQRPWTEQENRDWWAQHPGPGNPFSSSTSAVIPREGMAATSVPINPSAAAGITPASRAASDVSGPVAKTLLGQ